MVNKSKKLAIFDIDGTIAQDGEIPREIVAGITHLQTLGFITTISTGRGYVRMREAFGDLFETLISPNALIIMEHGTKIVRRDGHIEFAEYLTDGDIGHIMDFIRANIEIVKLVWFNGNDPKELVRVWIYDARDLENERQKRGHYAEVTHTSLGKLRELLLAGQYSNVTARLRDHVHVHNLKLALTHSPISLVFIDGNMEFIRNNANKGLAVRYLLNKYRINVADLMVAGNAINDVEMLDIGATHRIVVGLPHSREAVVARLSDRDHLTLIDSPQDFGLWMQKFRL